MLDSRQSLQDASQTSAETRTVLIVDDSDFERVIIRSAVEGLTDCHVCGEASNGAEGIKKAVELKPDLVVMDLAMPLMNGLEAATVLKNSMPGIPIVLLTLYAEEIAGIRHATFGINAVLSKFDGLVPLVQYIQRLLG